MGNTVITALQLLSQTLATVNNLAASASQIGALVQKAQAEGRTTFTADEWAVIQGVDSQARNTLIQQITAALQK